MKNAKYILPNALTLLNLVLGILAIIIVLRGQNEYHAAWLIIAAAVCDLFDGLAARALDARSEFGKNLDSLADMVSFGVAPSIILFQWFYLVLTKISTQSTFAISSADFGQLIILLLSLLFAVGVAIRLARYNLGSGEERDFTGLSSTSAALTIASLWLLIGNTESEMVRSILLNLYFILSALVILFFLMISQLKMISLKFKGIRVSDNTSQYLVLVVSLVLIVVFLVPGIVLSMLFYILYSLAMNFLPRK